MQLQEFEPENELENAIADTRKGVRQVADLMRIIARSNLFISSKGEVQSDFSGFDPLVFEMDGNPFVGIFSSLSRPGLHGHMAEYVLQMNGREFFLRMPESYGVILNPGYVPQLIIPPTGVSEFRKDLKGRLAGSPHERMRYAGVLDGDDIVMFPMTAETDERILSEANSRNFRVLRKPLKPINLRAALMCAGKISGVARMERSAIRDQFGGSRPGFRFAPSGLQAR